MEIYGQIAKLDEMNTYTFSVTNRSRGTPVSEAILIDFVTTPFGLGRVGVTCLLLCLILDLFFGQKLLIPLEHLAHLFN